MKVIQQILKFQQQITQYLFTINNWLIDDHDDSLDSHYKSTLNSLFYVIQVEKLSKNTKLLNK